MKILFIILVFFSIISNVSASIKENIIKKFADIENVSFDFEQNINGKIENGNCIIEYPKKIYCKYDNFKKKIIVSNGKSLVIKNRAINQYFRYPLNKTPLNILLNKDYIIKEMEKIDGKVVNEKYYNFLLKQSENEINIFFDINSYDLIGWQTEDIYQNLVVTYIYNIEKNNVIKKKYFQLPPLN